MDESSNHPRRAIGQRPFRPTPSRSNGLARIETCIRRTTILAHPSQGGFVALEDATGVDFDFLGLDPVNPPPQRLLDQDAEDEFAKQLLLLGAKWWSSMERFTLFQYTYDDLISGIATVLPGEDVMAPTERERRLTVVGWPSSGGLWVCEFEVFRNIVQEYMDNEVDTPAPEIDPDISLVKLARTMDERCAVLRERFKAKYYSDLSKYEGPELLKSFNEGLVSD